MPEAPCSSGDPTGNLGELGYLDESNANRLMDLTEELAKSLNALIKALRNSNPEGYQQGGNLVGFANDQRRTTNDELQILRVLRHFFAGP